MAYDERRVEEEIALTIQRLNIIQYLPANTLPFPQSLFPGDFSSWIQAQFNFMF